MTPNSRLFGRSEATPMVVALGAKKRSTGGAIAYHSITPEAKRPASVTPNDTPVRPARDGLWLPQPRTHLAFCQMVNGAE
jgi:hypothetical protein